MFTNARDRLRSRFDSLPRPRRSGRLFAAVGLALAVAAPGGASVDVDCDTPDDFCTGNPCVTPEKIDVTVASCVLDFGPRDLVLSKKVKMLTSGSTLSLTAASIDVQRNIDGKQDGDGTDISLTATAGNILISARVEASGTSSTGTLVFDASGNVDLMKKVRARARGATSGGALTINAGGTVTSNKIGRIDMRGKKSNSVGGQVTITAMGGVDLSGRIDARGKPGGNVSISCPSCAITVNELIRVDGWRKTAGGGTVVLNAGSDITVTHGKGKIRADGRGPGAGTISLSSNGGVDASELRAEGVGVPGGTVAVVAGTVNARVVVANGTPGGTIKLTSTVGDVTLRSGKARSGSASGGVVDIDSAANATIESRAIVRGGTAGGEVRVSAPGDIALGTSGSAKFDARGAAGGVIEGAAGGDLTAKGKYQAAVGGCIGLSAGGTLNTASASFDTPLSGSCP